MPTLGAEERVLTAAELEEQVWAYFGVAAPYLVQVKKGRRGEDAV